MQVDVNVEILFLCFCSVLFTPRSLILRGQGKKGEKGEKGKRAEGFWSCYIEIYLIPPKALYNSTEVF